MLRRLGYVAIALACDATTNRTCRLRNATPERLRELIESNLRGLAAVLRYNANHGIRLYRISSQIIPFASHPANQLHWWDEFAAPFAELAELIRRHEFRVSMHPSHFTILNSPNPDIVSAARADLAWHTRFLDCLEVDASHKIIIHGGGAYGSKAEAVDRFVEEVSGLPETWRQRLVIENDERVFTVEDVLAISQRTGVPIVFDWLHHQANPGDSADSAPLIARCFDTWTLRDGPPKVHYSSQAAGARAGAHADWSDPDDFVAFLGHTPDRPFDCMLEAKKKDLALLRLRADLRARGIVERG